MKPVGLTVNAIPVTETVEPRMHLADLLRERLGLTGTHLRCEQGACGACTLLIDGEPARSCITYAVVCEGAQITTIEGLENDPVMIALRSRDDERLADFNIGFFSRQTQIAIAEGQGPVAADCSSERRRSDAGDRPSVARPDRAKPP